MLCAFYLRSLNNYLKSKTCHTKLSSKRIRNDHKNKVLTLTGYNTKGFISKILNIRLFKEIEFIETTCEVHIFVAKNIKQDYTEQKTLVGI